MPSSPSARKRGAPPKHVKLTAGYFVRILTRYILGEILSHTLIGCALFTFILLMKELPNILDTVVRNSSTFTTVIQVVVFLLPNFFMVTIPMAVLVGVLLGLSRLAADSEIIAMRASGLGIGYFVRVATIVAVGGTLLGLANSLYIAPRANQGILDLQKALASQATYQIQPRVFYEDFKNTVLYVQDVRSGTGAANWRQLFMADITDPESPKITTAASATVVSDTSQELLMRLRNGTEDDPVQGAPEQSNISTFAVNDMPFASNQQTEGHLGRLDTVIYALPMQELIERTHGPDGKRFLIELHKRFSYPAACLVLMLVGVPLGVTSRRGGKSSAWVFTILLVILYYSLSLIGIAMGRQNWIPTFLAVWSANILFAIGGLVLLWQMASGNQMFSSFSFFTARRPKAESEPAASPKHAIEQPRPKRNRLVTRLQARFHTRKVSRGVFPRILDQYVVLEFLNMFALVLLGFVLLMLVFTVFDRLGDILRNHVPLATVGAYLINLTPSMLYQIAPLAVLIAVLVTFGVLNRNSEIIAMKATGISLYRLVVPIVAIATILAVSLFMFDEYYLPQANKRQDALLNVIKGKPAQTVSHPEQNWIFGQPRPGEPGRIFYYRFFDPDRNEFANISVFEFDPTTFALTRRIFAAKAVWNPETDSWHFENGWESDIQGDHATGFRQFLQTSFAEIHEDPGYFKKESLQAQEMNFGQLGRYINDLRQSGFDTMKLRVALWNKLSYPLVAVIMAVLAIPFSLTMGRRGSLTGIAVAIGVALTYFVVENLFGALGNVNYLPAALAAWSSDMLFGLVGGYLLLRTPT
jgi:LPS export ABC transporter permease LptG/LPS export ABC transporter permease LptF